MKNLLLLLSVLLFITISTVAQTITLQEGTVVRVELLETLDSRLAKVGDLVNLRVNEDVEVDGVVVIKRGTEASGRLTQSRAAKMFGKKGTIDFSIDYAKSVTGKNIRLNTTRNGGDGKTYVDGSIANASSVGLGFGLANMRNATLEKGRVFSAYVGQDYELILGSSENSTVKNTPNSTESKSKTK